ncbi:uncharacterized protein LOC134745237 [Cydia strobilella]|uniref:uncharacterized protein LOC134745237 n=1 Tax=Cydia strobilella TaxID=1100964 RepID=UPI003003FDD9
MSWFETVKSVAKTVGKKIVEATPPVTRSVGGGSAVPDHHSGWWSVLSPPSTSGNSPGEGSSESDSDSERLDEASGSTAVVEVTTRARYTYELDRFQKNALLMFVQMKSEPPGSSRVEETTTQDINVILDVLAGFRFEANTHIDLTCSEIENKCQEFFQQNFTEYGAVIVVVLTFDGTTGQLSALDGRLSESIILRHLTDNVNPTLLTKPKIYITEANRIISSENGLRLISISLEGHQDVLGFHIPTMEHQSMIRRPLLLICDNIKKMADTHDFATILKKSAEDIAAEANSVFVDNPIEYCNKFTKEMILARS